MIQDIPGRRDARRVLECLQRSLKIADVCITGGVNAQLFIEILNHYVFFFEADNPEVSESDNVGQCCDRFWLCLVWGVTSALRCRERFFAFGRR